MISKEEELLVLKFDAACDNNSKLKLMGVGVAVWVDGTRQPDFDYKEMHGTGTNNIGEWLGLVSALKLAFAYVLSVNPNVRIRIYGDSQLIVRQFSGQYEVKKDYFMEYYEESRRIYRALGGKVKRVEWIPRLQNKEADILSKEAIKEYLADNNLI